MKNFRDVRKDRGEEGWWDRQIARWVDGQTDIIVKN